MRELDLSNPVESSAYIRRLIQVCEDWSDVQKTDRDTVLEYYDGKMTNLPADPNRSKAVSKDIRDSVKKLMPTIMRTLLGNEKIVEYHPTSPINAGDAEAATMYVNRVVVPKCGAEDAIYDAIFSALLLKTGILKWGAYRNLSVKYYDYRDQTPDVLQELQSDPDNEIENLETKPETDPEILQANPQATRSTFRVKKVCDEVDIKLEAIPRGSFLIHPDAESIEDSPLVGQREYITRSDLVQQGYDKDLVDSISSSHSNDDDDHDDRQAWRGDDYTIHGHEEIYGAMEEVLVYRVYVRMDQDDDGIPETHYYVMGEGRRDVDHGGEAPPVAIDASDSSGTSFVVLEHELVSDIPYTKIVSERTPHQFEGHSLAEDEYEIQRVKTALLRSTLDNVYWQNNIQPYIDRSKVMDLDAVLNPAFGKPVFLRPGTDAGKAVTFPTVPFVAETTFNVMNYMDSMSKERTGVDDRSGGLDPEAFQNITATSAQIMNESGLSQAQMMTRSLCQGLKKAFSGILELVVENVNKLETVQIQGVWHDFEPGRWDSSMLCEVNIGLGTASRESDLAVLQTILAIQRELFTSMGPMNPIVKPEQLYNTIEKIVEAAGLPSAASYFTKPTPEDMQQFMQSQQQQGEGAAEQAKLQGQMAIEQLKGQNAKELEQIKAQATIQVENVKAGVSVEAEKLKASVQERVEQAKANAQAQVEETQMKADIIAKRDETEAKYKAEVQIEGMKQTSAQADRELKYTIHQDEMALKEKEIGVKAAVEIDKTEAKKKENGDARRNG